ncbi:glycosyltransferase family protein [Cohnella rhizosphaerae]|uniref:Glycosyltransferase family protein n=1 Tax=Cohnella rhizosphaerae TaxID=1457232 RepID=A0A9X4QUU7_9BACL|nr:glycosyltransferase family protein [Cohnella rhizosphaerae]MDG0811889.1 glycosyltransferase family protein [Cohnella rhizosphaerae]
MKTVIIIQARMGSSRLHGKILLPLHAGSVLQYVYERCKAVKRASEVVIATTEEQGDDLLAQWCAERGYKVSRGSEEDVLGRYYECARAYGADYVMRVTSDCPFVDYRLADEMIEAASRQPVDIVRLEGELPRGLEPQLVSFAALEWMYEHAMLPHHREHVLYYAYEHPERFCAVTHVIPETMRKPELRITIDTAEDYRLMQEIAKFCGDDRLVPSKDIVQYLCERPEIAAINAHVQQKPVISEDATS